MSWCVLSVVVVAIENGKDGNIWDDGLKSNSQKRQFPRCAVLFKRRDLVLVLLVVPSWNSSCQESESESVSE